jgi:ribonuclease Y
MEIYLVVIFVMLAFGGGIAAMFAINNSMLKSKAEKIVKDAEAQAEITKNKMLEAKEKFLSLKAEHEKEVQSRNAQIIQNENKLKQMENTLKQKTDAVTKKDQELEQVRQSLNKQMETVKSKQEEVDKIVQNQVKQLEKLQVYRPKKPKNKWLKLSKRKLKQKL